MAHRVSHQNQSRRQRRGRSVFNRPRIAITGLLLLAWAFPSPLWAAPDSAISYHPRPGTEYVYAMLVEIRTGSQAQFVGGIVVFRNARKVPRRAVFNAHDNITDGASREAVFRGGFPLRSRRLPSLVRVRPEFGNIPAPQGSLPHFLGRPIDWFLPMLARAGIKSHQDWGGRYQVRTKYLGVSDGELRLEDSRRCQSDDAEHQLVGQGVILIDLEDGMIKERTFSGQVVRDGMVSDIKLFISRLDERQVAVIRPRSSN